MTRLRLFAVLALFLGRAVAADLPALLAEASAAEARLDSVRALELFLQADAARPGDADILQKIAKQYSDLVPDQPTKEAKRDYATRALAYARRSHDLAPNNAVHVLALAICHGHLAVVGDARTKVEMSRLIKEDAERALRLDPGYAWAHHILGRWHYEVAGLNGVARFFANLLYGGIPPASYAEGITHLRRATELDPAELNHWLDLGFAYAAAGRTAEARASTTPSPSAAPARRWPPQTRTSTIAASMSAAPTSR
jgi:tetratricopeptide (TPR) repeat protein